MPPEIRATAQAEAQVDQLTQLNPARVTYLDAGGDGFILPDAEDAPTHSLPFEGAEETGGMLLFQLFLLSCTEHPLAELEWCCYFR